MATICPSILAATVCLNNACPNPHDTSNFCQICNIALTTAAQYNAHVRTAAHSQALNASQWLKCTPCNRHYLRGSLEQKKHEKTNGHIQLVARHPVGGDPAVVEISAPPKQTRCDACRQTFLSSTYDEHRRTPAHITRERVYNYNNAVLRSQANQRGVEVSGSQNGIDLGVRAPAPDTNATPTEILLKCVGETPVSLTHVRTSSSVGLQSNFRLCFTITTVQLPTTIAPEGNVATQVSFNPQGQRGRFEDRLEFVFQDNAGTFVITRPVKATAGNNDLVALAATTPYRRPRRAREREESNQDIIDVEDEQEDRPRKKNKRGLGLPAIPKDIQQLLRQVPNEDLIRDFRERFLPAEGLTMATYQKYWTNLVHAEHFQAEQDLKAFDMDDVQLQKTEHLYRLTVPGLAEKRPSVLEGDRIKLHPHSKPDDIWFRGIVRKVEGLTVLISFHGSFPHTPTEKYDVQFLINPVTFMRMKKALAVGQKRSNVLFPTTEDMQPMSNAAQNPEQDIVLYNRILGANLEQRNAVTQVTRLPPGSPPFIVFGPPGTGKTVTVVECISQLLDNEKNRILACAPSNPASDVIAQRLISLRGLQPDKLLRVNARGRPRQDLPEELNPYSVYDGKEFSAFSAEKLNSYQVIIATCSSSAFLYRQGVDPGAFTHIFIDEAGQGSEPEIMIPILLMAGPKTNIILSGDPKQLGPVISSPVARPLGLNLSYLERLMASPAYDEVAMRGVSVAKLLQNFRSHASIISFPNEQFYRNELIAHASQDIANSLVNWNRLPTANFPVIFDAVAGEDMREGTSPSYFNPHEVSLVKDYVQGLAPFIASTSKIGIVTPYKAQVGKIRKLLKDNNITDVDIGSVEQFQGQERQVIIVSTVRSNRDLLSFDVRHTLGFVAHTKRLNVAITRAQSLLVVVGDPIVLGLDPLWRRFMYFVHRSGGWKGAPFPWNPDANPDDDPATFDGAEQDIRDLLRRANEAGSPGELDPTGGDE
ncbi:P-loop containing nucleoside triphosphate hydrolase protein [Rhizoctonia solani]|nr:P-loop containing nucleoside triphosphate hydrolase protein [Rhizoctonia solani]